MKERAIAKTPHRVFEIYAIRDEAIQALTPKIPTSFDYEELASATYKQLSVSAEDCTLHVQFVCSQCDRTTLDDLREDFLQLSQNMVMNAKVLVDFEGVEEFCVDSINLVVEFNKRLRNKGSRVVLCCINSEVQSNFFPTRNKQDSR